LPVSGKLLTCSNIITKIYPVNPTNHVNLGSDKYEAIETPNSYEFVSEMTIVKKQKIKK